MTIATIALLFAALSGAQTTLLRVPSAANYEYLLENPDKVCNECIAILSGPAKPGSCPLAIVRSVINPRDLSDAGINTLYFGSANGTMDGMLSVKDNLNQRLSGDHLKDTDNSEAYTGELLTKAMTHASLSDGATVLVPAGSLIDTSILVKLAGDSRFVIEQASSPQRFAANLDSLRERQPSQQLAVFDFSPQSKEAVRAMGAESADRVWRRFSRQISASFSRVQGNARPLRPRTMSALEARLKDPTGGVVVIYGHSDGDRIFLDTETGIQTLTVEDIIRIGSEAGGKLPPIILLNCIAKPVLAAAFLNAGAPFVAASDKSLGVDEASRFLGRLAQAVYVEKHDVIDAYYVAQQEASPYRLRPLADTLRTSVDLFLAANTY